VSVSASVSVDMKRTMLGAADLLKVLDAMAHVLGREVREMEKADARAKRVMAAIVTAGTFMDIEE
jgi:hypothetical protein